MPGSPRLSVVIPTYNRKKRLHLVLAALERQTVAPGTFEAVVIDDGSSDGTTESLQEARYSFPIQSFRTQNGGPARARNLGVEKASGKLVLFLDDDVEPMPQLITEHLRMHDAESHLPLVVMGPLSSLPHYAQPWVAWEQDKIEIQYAAMREGWYTPSYRQFWTGNASLARARILDVGGFNTSFPRGEDVELGIRLHKSGLQFRFNPQAIGYHHAERSLESWAQAHRSYGRLEVDIFCHLDEKDGLVNEDGVIETLAGNISRLHIGTRWVLRGCLGRPRVSDAAEKLMRGWLESKAANHAPKISSKVCSVLANLLYWQESADALGTERFGRVLNRADEIVRNGEVTPL